MKKSDRDYYAARLAQERRAASAAANPGAASIHRDLADHYADLVSGEAEEEEE